MTKGQENIETMVPDKALVKALRRLLAPLIRFLIEKNITLQYVVDILKEVYVGVAEESLRQKGQKITDSHISLMTGVHRKDVRKIRKDSPEEDRTPPTLSMGAELLAAWLGRDAYLDEEGNPLALPYIDKKNPKTSFFSLAEEISTDVRPRALLDELVRLDIISYSKADNLVSLKAEAFISDKGLEEKLYYFGKNTSDHIAAATHNILGGTPPFFDRSVYSDGLSLDSIRQIQLYSKEEAMAMLHRINRKVAALSEKDKSDSDAARFRINLGTYFYSDMHGDSAAEEEE